MSNNESSAERHERPERPERHELGERATTEGRPRDVVRKTGGAPRFGARGGTPDPARDPSPR